MTAFEFRKNFCNRATLLILLGLLVLDVVNIASERAGNTVFDLSDTCEEVYWEQYERFSGEITEEKIRTLMDIYRPIAKKAADMTLLQSYDPDSYIYNSSRDEIFFSRCFVEEMEYDYLYQNYAYNIAQNARDNMELYRSMGNEYEYLRNQQIAEDFSGRKIRTFAYTEMYHHYLAYDDSSLLLLLLCLFSMAGVFVIEKETEMDMLIMTSYGGGNTALAKLSASFLFVLSMCIGFWMTDFLAHSLIYGSWEAAFSPIYALPAFQNTPLRVSLLAFSFLMAGIKTLGIWGCSLLYLLLSKLCRNVLIPFVSGLCVTAGLIVLQFQSLSDVAAKLGNPMELVCCRWLFTEESHVNLLGQPVRVYTVVIFSVVAGSILVSGLILAMSRRRRR